MDKLEAFQKVLRFSDNIREWREQEKNVYFDDFDSENVNIYDEGGYGELAEKGSNPFLTTCYFKPLKRNYPHRPNKPAFF